ncbi:MAG: hypothetical protein M3N57_07130 [Actinomycetota bacterium]|nr:hypothetical protein [Actinomycetota bacterium]
MVDQRDRHVIHVTPEISTWTPAQILAIILGVTYLVLGGVALLRTGAAESIFAPQAQVAGLTYTPLLGVIEVIFGLLLLGTGASPRSVQGVLFLGVVAIAFGLLLVIEPTAFQDSIAAGRAHGWFYVVTGGIAALVSLISPAAMRRSITSFVRDYDARDRDAAGERRDRTHAAHDAGRGRRGDGRSGETRRIDLADDDQDPSRTTRMPR